jgi:hypothetical protein
MAVEQDRKIIRLFNQLRRLERAGRPTANVRRLPAQAGDAAEKGNPAVATRRHPDRPG